MIIPEDARVVALAGSFMAFLNERHPGTPVILAVAPDGYYSVVVDGEHGFGAYGRMDNIARICVISPLAWLEILDETGETEDAQREFLWTIAHEYAHHLQADGNEELSQEEADGFAERIVEEYLGGS